MIAMAAVHDYAINAFAVVLAGCFAAAVILAGIFYQG
jgi:hypothetical protein